MIVLGFSLNGNKKERKEKIGWKKESERKNKKQRE